MGFQSVPILHNVQYFKIDIFVGKAKMVRIPVVNM